MWISLLLMLLLLLFVSPYTRQQLVVRWLVEIYTIITILMIIMIIITNTKEMTGVK